MSLFFDDNFSSRVAASGVSAHEYAVRAYRDRMFRLFELPRRRARALAEAEQRRKLEAAREAAEQYERYKRKVLWRDSWKKMVRLALSEELKRCKAAADERAVQNARKPRFMTSRRQAVLRRQREAEVVFREQMRIAELILHEVADKHGIPVSVISQPHRYKATIAARYEFFWRARHETTLSLERIGLAFGGFDHTTVRHGVIAHQARLDAEAS